MSSEFNKKVRNYLNPTDVEVVIYHKDCNDGLASALCVYKVLGEKAIYIGLQHTDPFNYEILKDKNVLVVDFSFDEEKIKEMRKIAKKVMILDHHISAKEKLENVEGCFFDMSHSAAYLAYVYMNGDVKPPKFILYIEDRDIWKWEYREKSEAMFYGLREAKFSGQTFKLYTNYLDEEGQLEGQLVQELIKMGEKVIEKNKVYIENISKKSEKVNYTILQNNYKIMLLALENPKLISEISENLYNNNDVDFTLLWFPHKDNKFVDLRLFKILYGPQKYVLSFRTNKENIDVSKIATSLKGGGHVKAAGAVIEYHPNDMINNNNFVLFKFFKVIFNKFIRY